MITFDVIRGHKLILWADRLDFQPEFTARLDKFATHYVQQVRQVDSDAYNVILFAQVIDQSGYIPIMFTCDSNQLNSLVEKVQVEE